MTDNSILATIYQKYIDCLNRQDWANLGEFVSEDVRRNDETLGLAGYLRMLQDNYIDIPDLHFNIQFMVVDMPYVASRLFFNCTPKGQFLDLPVNGKRIRFAENVFYQFRDGKIETVWSVIDKSAIEAQI